MSYIQKTRCILCEKLIEQPEASKYGEWCADGGLWFEGTGGWPSTVWDPLPLHDDLRLRIFICEQCARDRAEMIVMVHISHTVEAKRVGTLLDEQELWKKKREAREEGKEGQHGGTEVSG